MGFYIDILLPKMIGGFLMTLKLLALIIPVTLTLALLVALIRVYAPKYISIIAAGYVYFFRGIPSIVLLLLLYFGLPRFGIFISSYWTVVFSFWLTGTSYMSEYYRTAINSIGEEQSVAARSLGISKIQEIIYVILPQALRISLPGISNEVIYEIKYTSVAYVVGVSEIFLVAKDLNSIYLKSIPIFLIAGLFYIFLTTSATKIFSWIEKKARIPGVF